MRPLGEPRLSRRRAGSVLAAPAGRRARSRRARAVPAGARPDEKLDQDKASPTSRRIRAARSRLPGGGKVGAVGYCLGGRLAFMAAARTDVDALSAIMASGSRGCSARSTPSPTRSCFTLPAPTISSRPTSRRDSRRAGRSPQGHAPRLSRRGSWLRRRDGPAPQRGGGEPRRRPDRGLFRGACGLRSASPAPGA